MILTDFSYTFDHIFPPTWLGSSSWYAHIDKVSSSLFRKENTEREKTKQAFITHLYAMRFEPATGSTLGGGDSCCQVYVYPVSQFALSKRLTHLWKLDFSVDAKK